MMPQLSSVSQAFAIKLTAGRSGVEMKRKKTSAEAYFTVEAAMVIPIVLGILVMLIYLAFYLYDRCILAQDCYVLSYRQSIEKGGADRAGPSAAAEQLGEKLFMLSGIDTDCSAGGTVCVSGKGNMSPPLVGLEYFNESGRWNLEVKEKAKKTDPPKDYRRVRRILHLAGAVQAH